MVLRRPARPRLPDQIEDSNGYAEILSPNASSGDNEESTDDDITNNDASAGKQPAQPVAKKRALLVENSIKKKKRKYIRGEDEESVVDVKGVNAGFTEGHPFFPEEGGPLLSQYVEPPNKRKKKNRDPVKEPTIVEWVGNEREEDVKLSEMEEVEFWLKCKGLKQDMDDMFTSTNSSITTMEPTLLNKYDRINPRRPCDGIHIRTFKEAIQLWKENGRQSHSISVSEIMAFHKIARRYKALYSFYDRGRIDKFVKRQITNSMPQTTLKKRTEHSNTAKKRRGENPPKLELNKEAVRDHLSISTHFEINPLTSRQIMILKKAGLGYRKLSFQPIYDINYELSSSENNTIFSNIKEKWFISNPSYHFEFLPQIYRNGLSKILDIKYCRDPFATKFYDTVTIEEPKHKESIRSWNLDEFKFTYPPKTYVAPDVDVRFMNFFNEVFPDEGTKYDRCFYDKVICSPRDDANEDPLFDFGRPSISIRNTIFDKLLSKEPIGIEGVMFMQRIWTSDVPTFSNHISYLYINKDMASISNKWNLKGNPLSANDKIRILDYVWMQAHPASWYKYKRDTRYGVLTWAMIQTHFRFFSRDPDTIDHADLRNLGLYPVDVKGDGNCAFYVLFLAMVNAGLWYPKKAAEDEFKKKKKTKQKNRGGKNSNNQKSPLRTPLENHLYYFSISMNVKNIRSNFRDYIEKLDPASWMFPPAIARNAFGCTDEEKYNESKELFNEFMDCVYRNGVEYDKLTTEDTDCFPGYEFLPMLWAYKYRLRVVLYTYWERKDGTSNYDTHIFDYRKDQKATDEYVVRNGIYKIPDDDFNREDTIEFLYQQENQDIESEESKETEEAKESQAMEETKEQTLDPDSTSENSEEDKDQDGTKQLKKPTTFGHYQFIFRERPNNNESVDNLESTQQTNSEKEKEDKVWKKSLSNSYFISIPVGFRDGNVVSVFVGNYNKKPIGKEVDYTEDDDDSNKPFLMINCAETFLDKAKRKQLENTVFFYLFSIYNVMKWVEKIDRTKVLRQGPSLQIIDEAFSSIKFTKRQGIVENVNLKVYYANQPLAPSCSSNEECSIQAMLAIYTSRNYHFDADQTFKNESRDIRRLFEIMVKQSWGNILDVRYKDVIPSVYPLFKKKLVLYLWYIKLVQVYSYGKLTDAEIEDLKDRNAVGNPIGVKNTIDGLMFKDFYGSNKRKSKELFHEIPSAIDTSTEGGGENDSEESVNSEPHEDEELFEEVSKLPSQRLVNPERIDINGKRYNNQKLSNAMKKRLDKIEDVICPDVAKQVFDLKRISEIAEIFALNGHGMKNAPHDERENLEKVVQDAISGDYDSYIDYVGELAKVYNDGTHSLEEEQKIWLLEEVPQTVVQYEDSINAGKDVKDQTDVMADYSIHVRGAAAMQIVETMKAHCVQMKEHKSLKLILERKKKNPSKHGGVTNQEKKHLENLNNSIKILGYNILDKLDMLFPVNNKYGYNETKQGNEINRLRYEIKTTTFYGLSKSHAEIKLRPEWVRKNFHPAFVKLVMYFAQDSRKLFGDKIHWTTIPAGDARNEYKTKTITEKENQMNITFMKHLKTKYTQGRSKYCVACSFASALHLLHFFDAAKLIIEVKEELSVMPSKMQIQFLESFSRNVIPLLYRKAVVIYTNDKTTKKNVNPFKFMNINTMWFIIPQTTDGGVNHSFVIIHLKGRRKICKFIVDGNDAHPLVFSGHSLNYCCGPPFQYERVKYAIMISFKKFDLELVDDIIGEYSYNK